MKFRGGLGDVTWGFWKFQIRSKRFRAVSGGFMAFRGFTRGFRNPEASRGGGYERRSRKLKGVSRAFQGSSGVFPEVLGGFRSVSRVYKWCWGFRESERCYREFLEIS